ncbi:glycosyltransferase family 2 protein [Limosilactobacillus fermentum]|uniref:glycosyltransferase family 2 protein n=2 Tax=Limosilactobacillus fermentum TaxID=1613 RepID=UPI001E5E854E|nr:glycosyltransferase family 2 protein [Limosilactobacillus fermentum]MCE0560873.1 glycosyltransferase family 2 protein [Limosilactobacillus fermentum]
MENMVGNFGTVAILMSTYNAEPFLKEQINSILGQTYTNWKLFIRDDGSSDSTSLIIEEFTKKDDRIFFVNKDSIKNVGVISSFFLLLSCVKADFYMFCDQDDVWLKSKVRLSLDRMNQQKKVDVPTLVHTDLKVVDQNLNIINESFMEKEKLNRKSQLGNLVIQNNVTGCTVMINNSFRNIVIDKGIPNEVIMHDWWMALVGNAIGETLFVDVPTMLYRQHNLNVVGSSSTIKKIMGGYGRKEIINSIIKASEQDKAFIDLYHENLSKKKLETINFAANMIHYPRVKRMRGLKTNNIFKSGFIRNLFFKILLFSLPTIR